MAFSSEAPQVETTVMPRVSPWLHETRCHSAGHRLSCRPTGGVRPGEWHLVEGRWDGRPLVGFSVSLHRVFASVSLGTIVEIRKCISEAKVQSKWLLSLSSQDQPKHA